MELLLQEVVEDVLVKVGVKNTAELLVVEVPEVEAEVEMVGGSSRASFYGARM